MFRPELVFQHFFFHQIWIIRLLSFCCFNLPISLLKFHRGEIIHFAFHSRKEFRGSNWKEWNKIRTNFAAGYFIFSVWTMSVMGVLDESNDVISVLLLSLSQNFQVITKKIFIFIPKNCFLFISLFFSFYKEKSFKVVWSNSPSLIAWTIKVFFITF